MKKQFTIIQAASELCISQKAVRSAYSSRCVEDAVPIVGMTAYTELGEEARCLAAGMDAYLSKPLPPIKLFDLVDRLLAGSIPAVSHLAT